MNQEKQVTRQMRAQIKNELAMELRYYLVDNTEERLQWMDTKTHLIELVMYLFEADVMTDDDGMPLSMMRIARMACQRFNIGLPQSLSQYKIQLHTIKGSRSRTLLQKAVFRHENNRDKLTIRQCLVPRYS